MAKYIINLNPDCVDGEFLRIPIRVAGEEQWIKTKASLTPYTEPDREAIENEVWEFAWKIYSMDIGEYAEIGCPSDYQEAKSKYESWKKRKEKVRVGDEVQHTLTRAIGVVTQISDLTIMWEDGNAGADRGEHIEKTGRHFDEVESLLERMREQE